MRKGGTLRTDSEFQIYSAIHKYKHNSSNSGLKLATLSENKSSLLGGAKNRNRLTLVAMLHVHCATAAFLASVVHVSAHTAFEEAATTIATQHSVMLTTAHTRRMIDVSRKQQTQQHCTYLARSPHTRHRASALRARSANAF